MATTTLRLDDFLPYQLSIASNAVSERIARHYERRFGINVPQWRLMAVLGEGGPRSQRDLVDRTRMDKVTVSRASAALVDRGLVKRQSREGDRRSHLIALTGDGDALYREIAPIALQLETRLLAQLEPGERDTLCSILLRLRQAADTLENEIHSGHHDD